jgi:uncharacterized membrane protein YeaQ/YmgE (transglycosylase-associated protein family)
MSILAWIVVGLIAGSLAQTATRADRRGCLGTIAIGILGAVVGGALFNAAGEDGITHFGLWSVFVAFIGATLLLLLFEAIAGLGGRRRRPRSSARY